jgi:hypothetical protein
MKQDFTNPNEFDPDMIDRNLCESDDETTSSDLQEKKFKDIDLSLGIKIGNDFSSVTNDEFLTTIFGQTFSIEHPLVCHKAGDPDLYGWMAMVWPCNTNQQDWNWYFLPSLYCISYEPGGIVFFKSVSK